MERTKTQQAIDEARDIIESFDDCGAATLGFDSTTYTLTADQMSTIARAIYLADCELEWMVDGK